jgi:hypothetical protein
VLAVVKGAKPWGVDVVDVRITRADYVEAITESVYRRMEAERKRVANELRSTGTAEGEKIRADADRQREVIVANAYRDAQKIKGEGDAQAARASTARPSAATRSSPSSIAASKPTSRASTRRATCWWSTRRPTSSAPCRARRLGGRRTRAADPAGAVSADSDLLERAGARPGDRRASCLSVAGGWRAASGS